MIENVPAPVLHVLETLRSAGHDAYLVGGCVRDHLLGRPPKDYDVATNARPETTVQTFPKVIPTGIRYGTVTVMQGDMPIEVTTFRADGNYSDGRRPDAVTFSDRIEDDLARRDFTMNAMAWSPATGLVDPYGGQEDLQRRAVRCVGEPRDRFKEDALRMMRAIRFATTLDFGLTSQTFLAIYNWAHMLCNVSQERIREELNRILLVPKPSSGLVDLKSSLLLRQFLPELHRCYGFEQHNPHHRRDVFYHTLAVVDAIPPVLHLRLAAMLHDIGKPGTFTQADGMGHFYGHDDLGAKMAGEILERLKYDRATTDRVVHLVQHHMFPAEMGPKAIRRFVARVGAENVPDLLALRLADIEGSGVPDDTSHVDRIRQVLTDMQTAGIANPKADLAVNGRDVMEAAGLAPGPAVGAALKRLTELVLDDPGMNNRDRLLDALRMGTDPA